MNVFPSSETNFIIPGPAGDLELLSAPANTQIDKPITAIICHPHPLFAGTMQNKVVTTIKKACTLTGVSTVRFNFRGVGKSTGSYDEGKGELKDLFAVIDWVKAVHPDHEIWLAGFSFGAYIAALAGQEIQTQKLILVAPPVVNFNLSFSTLTQFSCDVYVLQGEQDEVVAAKEVFAWAKTVTSPIHLISFPETSHFFHGKLKQLTDALLTNLK